MSTTSSPSEKASPNPNKGLSNHTREDLEKFLSQTVRKLKAKEKQLTEVSYERDALAKQLSAGQDQAAGVSELQTQLQKQEEDKERLQSQLTEAQAASEDEQKQLSILKQDFETQSQDSKQQIEMLEEQTLALKQQIRQLAESRDAEISSAVKPLEKKIHDLTANASRVESVARSARASVGKSQAECQVLEGALEGTKSLLAAAENDKLSLEAQIQQLMVEATRNEAEYSKKIEDMTKLLNQHNLSPKSPTETAAEVDKCETATLRLELLNKMEIWKARESELLRELDEARSHAMAREVEVEEKVTQTQKRLDTLMPELQEAQTALSGARGQAENLQEARQIIAEKDMELQDMESRVSEAESALNVANAHLEEQVSVTSPVSQSGSLHSDKTKGLSSHSSFEPDLPDIKERRSFSSKQLSEEEQQDRIEKLESYVEQLEEEITHLRKMKDELAEVKAEKDKVENAVRNYLAEKPAEDALREKELQQARSETDAISQELQEAQNERNRLQAELNERDSPRATSQSGDPSDPHTSLQEGPEVESPLLAQQDLSASRAEVASLKERCQKLEALIKSQDVRQSEDGEIDSQASSEANGQISEVQSAAELASDVLEEGDHPNGKVQVVNRQLYETEVSNLKQKLQASRKKQAELAKQVMQLQESQNAPEALANGISGQASSESLIEAQRQVEHLEAQVASQQSRINQLEIEIQEYTSTQRDSKNQLDDAQQKVEKLQSRLHTLETELEQVSEAKNRAESALQETGSKLKENADLLHSLQSGAVFHSEKVTEFEKLLSEQQTERTAVEAELKQAQSELAAVKEQLENFKNDNSTADELQSAQSEVAQLTEAQETLRQTLTKEKERAHRFIVDLKKKLEKSTKELKQAEAARDALKLAEDTHQQEVEAKFASEREELLEKVKTAEDKEVGSLETAKACEAELASYKARAHSLLKSKDAELRTAKEAAESSVAASLSEAQSAAKKAEVELQKVKELLAEAEASHEEQLQEAEHRMEQSIAHLREALDEAHTNAESNALTIEQWRRRYEALEGRMDAMRTERRQPSQPPPHLVQKHADEMQALQQRFKALQEEFSSLKESSQEIAESRDRELERLLNSNAGLRDELSIYRNRRESQNLGPADEEDRSDWNFARMQPRQADDRASFYSAGSRTASGSFANNLGLLSRNNDFSRHYQDEGWNLSEGRPPSDWGFSQDPSQDPNLLRLSELQERRNEELTSAQKRAAELEAEIADLAREVELRQEQELALKEALREAERERSRTTLADKQRLDIEYLKNTVLKLYETGQAHVLLPAISTILHFSPAELKRCQEGLAKQAELFNEAAGSDSQSTASQSYLGNWTSWFGEGDSRT